jgi:hypothetical protein
MLDFFAAIADATTYLAPSFAPERPGGPLRVLQMSALKGSQELTVCVASDKARAARGNLTRKVVPKGEVSSTITEPPWA